MSILWFPQSLQFNFLQKIYTVPQDYQVFPQGENTRFPPWQNAQMGHSMPMCTWCRSDSFRGNPETSLRLLMPSDYLHNLATVTKITMYINCDWCIPCTKAVKTYDIEDINWFTSKQAVVNLKIYLNRDGAVASLEFDPRGEGA